MQPCKSDSFSFRRNTSANSSNSSNRSDDSKKKCRRRLQDNFEGEKKLETSERKVLSVLNLNDTRKVFRNGAERISKTFNTVRTTFGSISQRFKVSTRRRQILEEGPMTPNCQTPCTYARQVLGRTPTAMYSPFGIDSPYRNNTTIDKENVRPNLSTKDMESVK